MGRPGLDRGTLGAILEGAGTCVEMQIRWSDSEVCAPASSDVLLDPILWLQDWLPRVPRDSIAILGFEQDQGIEQVMRINFVN